MTIDIHQREGSLTGAGGFGERDVRDRKMGEIEILKLRGTVIGIGIIQSELLQSSNRNGRRLSWDSRCEPLWHNPTPTPKARRRCRALSFQPTQEWRLELTRITVKIMMLIAIFIN